MNVVWKVVTRRLARWPWRQIKSRRAPGNADDRFSRGGVGAAWRVLRRVQEIDGQREAVAIGERAPCWSGASDGDARRYEPTTPWTIRAKFEWVNTKRCASRNQATDSALLGDTAVVACVPGACSSKSVSKKSLSAARLAVMASMTNLTSRGRRAVVARTCLSNSRCRAFGEPDAPPCSVFRARSPQPGSSSRAALRRPLGAVEGSPARPRR